MRTLHRILFSQWPRALPYTRAWNIAFRTAHIGSTGILVGGHVFNVDARQLFIWLCVSILTGLCLVVLEAYPSFRWCYQGRGVLVFSKVLLLCIVPWLWDYRVPILFAVIVIASVGSHMPARFRYYSLVHRKVLE
jgi:hypothetical protein